MSDWKSKFDKQFTSQCCRDIKTRFWIEEDSSEDVKSFIHTLLEEQDLKQYGGINADLNKHYRGELQEMQRSKNKVLKVNLSRVKARCADDLKAVREKFVDVNFYDDEELDKLDKKWRK